MALDHTIPELDTQGLRKFGITTGIALVVLFSLLLPWLLGHGFAIWPFYIAVPLWALALIKPDWLGPIYTVWMRFGLFMSKIMTPLILGIVFFLIFTPMALFRRFVTRNDPMHRTLEADVKSYRIQSAPVTAEKLERPF